MAGKFEEAIALLRAGNKQQGGQLLVAVVTENPDHEMAWLCLSRVVVQPEQQKQCLGQVLRINLNNQKAREALDALDGGELSGSADKVEFSPKTRQPTNATSTERTLVELDDEDDFIEEEISQPDPFETTSREPLPQPSATRNSGYSFIKGGPTRLDIEENPELTQFVVGELGQHIGHNDIIMDVCQRAGVSWKQAEDFVADVEMHFRNKIAQRQSPLLIIIAIGSILGGGFLGGGSTFLLYDLFMRVGAVGLFYPVQFIWGPFEISIDVIRTALVTISGYGLFCGGFIGLWQVTRSLSKK